MTDNLKLAVIAGMTLVTLIPRLLPILLLSNRKLPPFVERWLSLVAPAILAALLVPELLLDRSATPPTFALSFSNAYLWGALPAFAVAWKTKSIFATVISGIATVALLRFLTI